MTDLFCNRYSINSLTKGTYLDPNGRLFMHSSGLMDLSHVNIVGVSVDTIRQLFYGVPREKIVLKLEDYLVNREETIFFHGEEFHLRRLGKTIGGYRYKLQNNDLGVVILFGSYYQKMDLEGSHMKIELSPHFIAEKKPDSINSWLAKFSSFFLDNCDFRGCAVHLAVDFQGEKFQSDFLDHYVSRTRTRRAYHGVEELDLTDAMNPVSYYSTGSSNFSYLLGRANALQLCVYNKSAQMKVVDKQDYYENFWDEYSKGSYDSELPVTRVECRFHHEVVRQIGRGFGKEFEDYLSVSSFLTDLWRYAMKNNRLEIDKGCIHPLWHLLHDEPVFLVPSRDVEVKRVQKKSSSSLARSVPAIIGNVVSIGFTLGHDAKQILNDLKSLSFYKEIKRYFRQKGMDQSHLLAYIIRGLSRRRLVGSTA